jgi:PKD repeat protein/poly(3-hydroxybutyrate) depolymerase
MNRLLLYAILAFVVFPPVIKAQSSCTSLRYQDTIFHSVAQTDSIYFASAVPFLSSTPENLYLDIYEPANDTLKNRPVIVYQFGGGFVIGWREEPDIPQFATYFAQLGYVVATIDYRIGLNPTDTSSGIRAFYRGTQDQRSAIRFLSQNAQQFGIDTTRIILTGTSAGCFTSFANCYMSDSDWPSIIHGISGDPTDLGCMDCSGNTDLGHHIPRPLAMINMWGAMLDTTFITLPKGVPTVSFQGTLDDIVPYSVGYPFQLPFVFPIVYGGLPIHQRMSDLGILESWHPLDGYSHEPELLAPWLNDTIYNYSRKFLWPLLKPQTSAITGDSVVCKNAVATYSVSNTPGSWYCWQLTGNGTIISNNNNAISVIWADTGLVGVSVVEMNDIDAQGDPKAFQTRVISHSQPNFTDSISQLQVSFTNTSLGATNSFWQFGNNDTSSAINPVENYSSPGHYHIELYTSNGYCTDSIGKNVRIDSCPVALFTAHLTGLTGVFVADSTNSNTYSWNFGDGDSASVAAVNVFHAYQQAGTYTVTLKVESALGCTSVDTLIIAITAPTAIENIAAGIPEIWCDNAEGCHIAIADGINATLQVFDVTGRELYTQSISGIYWFQTSALANGIYLIRVANETGTVVKKLIKQ